jgi:hypothetical protein
VPDQWRTDIDLGYLARRYREAAETVVDDAVAAIAKDADRRIPRLTGETARSQNTGRAGTRGWVAYNSRKALPLHEDLTSRHRRGGPKFLEQSLAGAAERVRRKALAEFRAATTRGK